MRWGIAVLITVCLSGQTALDDFKKRIAAYPADEQVYELWRYWLVGQPGDVQKLFDDDATKARGFEIYRKKLEAEGDGPAEAERKIKIIDQGGEHWEIERW